MFIKILTEIYIILVKLSLLLNIKKGRLLNKIDAYLVTGYEKHFFDDFDYEF